MGGGVSCMTNDQVIHPSSIVKMEEISVFEKELILDEKIICKALTATHCQDEDDDDEDINEDHLYSALFKLSFLFEINESLKRKLTEIICHIPHPCRESQVECVRNWIEDYVCKSLDDDEILNLIKYVELYEPLPHSTDDHDQDFIRNEERRHMDCDRDFGHLDCPFKCNIAVLAAEIQRQRLCKNVPQYSDTERCAFSVSSPRHFEYSF